MTMMAIDDDQRASAAATTVSIATSKQLPFSQSFVRTNTAVHRQQHFIPIAA